MKFYTPIEFFHALFSISLKSSLNKQCLVAKRFGIELQGYSGNKNMQILSKQHATFKNGHFLALGWAFCVIEKRSHLSHYEKQMLCVFKLCDSSNRIKNSINVRKVITTVENGKKLFLKSKFCS